MEKELVFKEYERWCSLVNEDIDLINELKDIKFIAHFMCTVKF